MATTAFFQCAHCQAEAGKPVGEVNRARRKGVPLYCDGTCAGMARRKNRTDLEKREAKRAYDIRYRAANPRDPMERAAYFRRTYDPEKARVRRKARMAQHVEYCRRPEYRERKALYDREYNARRAAGPFWESHIILQQLEQEVLSRASRVDIAQTNGVLNKSLNRRRDYERTVGNRAEVCLVGNPSGREERHDAARAGRRRGGAGPGNPAHGEGAASGVGASETQRAAGRGELRGAVAALRTRSAAL